MLLTDALIADADYSGDDSTTLKLRRWVHSANVRKIQLLSLRIAEWPGELRPFYWGY